MITVNDVTLPEVEVTLDVSCDECGEQIGQVDRETTVPGSGYTLDQTARYLVEELEEDPWDLADVVGEVGYFAEDEYGTPRTFCESCYNESQGGEVVETGISFEAGGGTIPPSTVDRVF